MTGRAARRVILFVHCADEWYGSDYVLHEAVHALEGTEFRPVVVVPDDVASDIPSERRLSARLSAAGVTVHRLPVAVLRRRYMSPAGIAELMKRQRVARRAVLDAIAGLDVALVHSHTAGVMTGASVARALRVPHLWHVSEIVERPRAVARWLARRISGRADRVVAVSHAVRDHLVALTPRMAPRATVIHNAIDATRFDGVDARAERLRLSPDDGCLVGLVGRVGMQKGQEILLEAMRDVVRDTPGVRIALIGGVLDRNFDALERLRALAASTGLAERTTIDGYTVDVAPSLAAMDVVVQPSTRADSFPTTVLEAMASGKPVIASDNGGSREMVVHGETGFIVPTGDVAALAAAIGTLVRDPALRARMGAAGRARVAAEFGPARFREGYLREYRALCASAAATTSRATASRSTRASA